MFYEQPSMRMTIDGFFQKKDRTYKEFEGLFGFDKIKTGLPYEMLQACTLVYVDNNKEYPPYDSMVFCDASGDVASLHVEDYNNATIYLTFADGSSLELRYMYRNDNYPSIEVVDRRSIKHVREIVPGCGLSQQLVIQITGIVIPFLTKLLFEAYGEYHEND